MDLELRPWKADEEKIDADTTPIPSLHIKGNCTKEREWRKTLCGVISFRIVTVEYNQYDN